jgi:hypothetical protein
MTNGGANGTRELKILFQGLFYLSFPKNDSEGRVGVLSVPPDDHIMVITIKAGGGETKIELTEPAVRRLPKHFFFEKSGSSARGSNVSRKKLGGGETGWERPPQAQGRQVSHKDLFGFIIDFEGPEMHGPDHSGAIKKKKGKLRPILHFNAGEFYTEHQSKCTYEVVRKNKRITLGRVAEVLGVRIGLAPKENLILRTEGMKLPIPDTVTEIFIQHLRPDHFKHLSEQGESKKNHASGKGNKSSHPGTEDMQLYYKFLNVPKSKRFDFKIIKCDTPGGAIPPFSCFGSGGNRSFAKPED